MFSKLEQLEKKFKELKEELSKQGGQVNTAGSGGTQSIAAQINWPGARKSEDHEDEKEDKEMIAEALDEHNEKKHGESKDKDSAFKDLSVKKDEGFDSEVVKFDKNGQWSLDKADIKANPVAAAKERYVDSVVASKPAPMKVINPKTQEVTMVTPEQNAKIKADKAAANKAKFEAEAKARREQYKQEK